MTACASNAQSRQNESRPARAARDAGMSGRVPRHMRLAVRMAAVGNAARRVARRTTHGLLIKSMQVPTAAAGAHG